MEESNSHLEIKLKRPDRLYRPNEIVEGSVVVHAKKGWSHKGLKLISTGTMFVSTSRPGIITDETVLRKFPILQFEKELAPAGSYPDGLTEVPFQFEVKNKEGEELLESYHGVYISVVYLIHVECERSMMSLKISNKTLVREMEFVIEIPVSNKQSSSSIGGPNNTTTSTSIDFNMTPETLKNVNPKFQSVIPKFQIIGKLHRDRFPIHRPFTGELIVKDSESPIRSIELQLVRVETVIYNGKSQTDASEVQNIQICDGDVCRDIPIPIYMVFPRLYASPTMSTQYFKVEFEVNMQVVFQDGYLVAENFPIVITREV